jgi:hypothetical protein
MKTAVIGEDVSSAEGWEAAIALFAVPDKLSQ